MANAEVSAIDLIRSLNALGAGTTIDPTQMDQLKVALFHAQRRLQTPFEIAGGHVWAQPVTNAAIKTLIDAGFWKKWADSGRSTGTVKELSELSGFDEVLLRRLLRGMAGQGLVEESGPDEFTTTAFTSALGGDKFSSMYACLLDFNQPCYANFPEFVRKNGYSNPTNGTISNFNDWSGSSSSFFEWMSKDENLTHHFNNTMTVYAANKSPWTSIYPVKDLLHDMKEDRPLVVDVAGGVGHDLEKFRTMYPSLPHGSLILQDQPGTIANAKVQAPCIAQAHDILTVQPVKEARVYYLHNVLHDWTDASAVQILKNLVPAMEKGYSKILIHEKVIADSKAHPNATVSDLVMMMSFSALERSERQWRGLVSQAGCKVVKIWAPHGEESIIEVEVE